MNDSSNRFLSGSTLSALFIAVITVVFIALLVIVPAYLLITHHSSDASYSCVAGPGEICASDQFYADYVRWDKLRHELPAMQQVKAVRELQDKSDLLDGMTRRLNAAIPSGYIWDDGKKRFLVAPQKPAQAPVPTVANPVPVSGAPVK